MVRIGVCLSLSGEFSEAGKKNLAGIKIRADEFNADWRKAGFRLELVVRDDKSNRDTAVAVFNELAGKEGVPAVIGPLSTTLMLAMADAARDRKVVLLSPTVTSPKIGKNGDWCFRLLFDDQFQGVVLARFVLGQLKLRRAAALVNNRLGYSGSVFESFQRVFEEGGGKIVAAERYEWVADEEKLFNFVPLLQRIDKANPEIILLPVNSTEVAAIIRDSLRAGVRAGFCGGDTWQHELVLVSSGNNLDNSHFVCGINFDSVSPAMRHWREQFDKSNDPTAQLTSVLGYDCLSLLIEALKNGRDGEAIREGLYRIKDLQLASGIITIHPERGSEKSAFIQRINKVGDEFRPAVVAEIKP